jgi:uncharacterized SAM-binding protein YcdF (DUF218 family)
LLPPASLFLAMAVGWLLRRRWPRMGRSIILVTVILLYTLCTPIVASFLLRSLEPDPVVSLPPPPGTGAIVVLGGDADSDGREFGGDSAGVLTLTRIRYAAILQRRTGLPVLITGGPLHDGGPPVSILMQHVLTDELDIPVRWVEDASRNTWENALFTAQMLRHDNIKKILLVTNAWHMPRAKAAFLANGLQVIPAPTGFTAWPGDIASALLPDAKALPNSAYAIHEMIGLVWYRLYYR